MLIVVVILWILSGTILPKISGYLEKTRDLKRQTDLRAIAVAIDSYRASYWELPLRKLTPEEDNHIRIGTKIKPSYGYGLRYGTVHALKDELSPYISQLPHDPQKNSRVCIVRDCFCGIWGNKCKNGKKPSSLYSTIQEILVHPWEYLYQIFPKGAILVAKVETADLANYIVIHTDHLGRNSFSGHAFNFAYNPWLELEKLQLCDIVKKVAPWEEKYEANENWKIECFFSTSEQLYYIHKIE